MVFTVRATIEVLVYPEDHVKTTIEKIVEKLKNEEGIKIIKSEIQKTEKIKENFFASFAETEMKINDFSRLLNFCYNYLPSSLEILDADKITLPIREFSMGINEMLAKLHHYNLVVNNLSNKVMELKKENTSK